MMRTTAAAVRPTARGIPLPSIGVVAALAAAPVVITVLTGGSDLTLASVVAAVVGGAGVALGIDDGAAGLLAASPTPLAVRRTLRLLLAGAAMASAWVVAAAVAAAVAVPHRPSLPDLAVEALVSASIAVGIGALSDRQGGHRPGVTGAVGGFAGMLLVSLFSMRYDVLPRLGGGPNHNRWLVAGLAGVALAVWASLDPARRRLRVRRARPVPRLTRR